MTNLIQPGKKSALRYAAALQATLNIAEWLGHEMPDSEWAVLQPQVLAFLAIDEQQLQRLRDEMPVLGRSHEWGEFRYQA